MNMTAKKDERKGVTRRDFLKGASLAGMAAAFGLPVELSFGEDIISKSRVVLIRHTDVLDDDGGVNGDIIRRMLDDAVTSLLDKESPVDAWKELISPNDIVGIKSNEWGPLPTPKHLEDGIKERIIEIGVTPDRVSVGDRNILEDEVFLKSTALINVRPLRTHHWAGVGSLLKNYIMFAPKPENYHDNSCADLAKLWELPLAKGKTRLNILVMLTPLFHGIGRHHFDKRYTWKYNGLLVGKDPVAVDATGLRILEAKRLEHFGEFRPMKPPPHHIAFADIRHGLGVSDPKKIELIKLGWEEGVLI